MQNSKSYRKNLKKEIKVRSGYENSITPQSLNKPSQRRKKNTIIFVIRIILKFTIYNSFFPDQAL
ncbi:hypothetical protein DU52_02970 [Methanosarcina mazei]|uniref:Uncharacterized protein n=1 Tax=Methanosarcina mazei TaxID=2209 RepID=A0A0F8NG14_METMZ|nr:hypothetical protein DU52_02970 [Methanosarcina mazei]KKG75332.1 hypothetical protein DU46_05510 [Methanosarcina mazei]KKG82200.1 hypothetical protein DU55_06070 [Methanosarcina mazei]KKH06035.1 hypothetical protein DU51_07475 [Methanosarcina mazei]KKH39920.1 hypothetical protein DU71_08035 [Methanosarcina mazei]